MKDPRAISRYEISEKHKKLRLVLAIILLIIAAVAITTGIMSLLNKETGWQKVEITTETRSCSSDFVFQYYFTGRGAETTALHKQLQAAYSEAAVKAYQLFTPDEQIEGVCNVWHINHHPNEIITVDPLLYEAFSRLEGTPYLYLGPVYAHYYEMIFNSTEIYRQELDPFQNPQAAELLQTMADFGADREAIELELLGDNRVRLQVSGAYLDFAQTHEIESFIDFAYLTNGFIIDYFAQTMIDLGLTEGFLSSSDGYTRNLDSTHEFNYRIFDKQGDTIYPAGVMTYQGPISMVFAKNYPTAPSDAYYVASGEEIIHRYADPKDGLCRTRVNNLVSYSYDTGCVEVLLKLLPSFLGEGAFTPPEGVYSIWCEDSVLCYQDPEIRLTDLLQDETVSYTGQLIP